MSLFRFSARHPGRTHRRVYFTVLRWACILHMYIRIVVVSPIVKKVCSQWGVTHKNAVKFSTKMKKRKSFVYFNTKLFIFSRSQRQCALQWTSPSPRRRPSTSNGVSSTRRRTSTLIARYGEQTLKAFSKSVNLTNIIYSTRGFWPLYVPMRVTRRCVSAFFIQ